MVCRKSYNEVLGAIFVMTLIVFSSGSTLTGTLRKIWDLQDTQYLNADNLILAGNILQILSLGGVLVFLSNAGNPPVQLGLVMAMLVLIVLVLYLTNIDSSNKEAQWSAVVLTVINIYVMATSLFLGYGVCAVEELPAALGNMVKVLGGRR